MPHQSRCGACGAPTAVSSRDRHACTACVVRICRAASADWGAWFSFPQASPPDPGKRLPLPADDAAAHADLSVAYSEMGLLHDAVSEAVLAIAADRTHVHSVGDAVLGAITLDAWTRLKATIN